MPSVRLGWIKDCLVFSCAMKQLLRIDKMWWEEAPESWRNRERRSLHFHFLFLPKVCHLLSSRKDKSRLFAKRPFKASPRSFTGALISRTIKIGHTNVSERQLKEEDKAFCSTHISFSSLNEVLCSTVAVCSCVCARQNTGHGEKTTVSIRSKLDHQLSPPTQLGNKLEELLKEWTSQLWRNKF